ncbi:MAG: hypothetical protein ACOX9R_12595 [Armatimonadota bacterium]|jgi:hypothetical protein
MRICICLLALATMVLALSAVAQDDRPVPVRPGADNTLIYEPDEHGDTIPDFSTCGYRGGGVALPEVPTRLTLEPAEGDDTERIQAALDEIGAMPLDPDGFRGAVLLRAGEYQIEGALSIGASGVVLRGEGSDNDGTILRATGTDRRTLIKLLGDGSRQEIEGSRVGVLDEYVPVGARSLRVEDAGGISVGDPIAVVRVATDGWISAIGMDRIPERADGGTVTQWTPGAYTMHFERIVTAIDGDRITLDTPMVVSLDQNYGGGYVYRYEWPERISNVGIEHLRGISDFNPEVTATRGGEDYYADEEHAWSFIWVEKAEDAWVRDVTSVYFGYSCVWTRAGSSRVTVQDSACLDPVSQITGSRRYSFAANGQQALFLRCYARQGRHDFVMHARVPGPNAFVDCRADNAYSDSGPHHRWATGTLYDNVVVNGNALNVRNRGNSGTGHGWAGAQQVFWNCTADRIICQQPPTAQNWAIGCIAGDRSGDGYWASFGEPVSPRSLYFAQLRERLGDAAVAAVQPGG